MRWIVTFVLAAVAAGCSNAVQTTTEPTQSVTSVPPGPVAVAEANWQELGTDQYLVTVTEVGRSPFGCTWIFEAHGADTRSRQFSGSDNECDTWDVSVPALHAEILARMTELETSSGNLDVEWADTGVPISIDFDVDATEGEELSVTIEFQDLSAETAETSIRVALAEARLEWGEAEISDYRIEASEHQNYWMNGCTWIIIVANGAATEESVGPLSDSSNCFERSLMVEQLHDQIARWADEIDQFSDPEFGKHTLEADFNEFGVPVSMKYDLANGSDEESSLSVIFVPTP